jgi:hypothetical protein
MHRVAPLLLLPLALAVGCSAIRWPFASEPRGMSRGVTLEGLQEELSFFASSFGASVTTAGDDISASSSDRRIRRNALIWRLNTLPVAQRAAFAEDPRGAYVRCLLLAIVQRRYLSDGDGKALFGDQQSLAIEAAQRIEQDALAIGERFLTQAELKRVQTEVNDLAVKFPMQGREFSVQRVVAGSRQLQQSDVFTSVLNIPLSPFRALEGVDSGAQAIREFNVTARRFTDIAAQLPVQLRGELELLLYDVEDRDTVVQGLKAFQSMADSADRASAVVEELPEELRANLEGADSSLARIQDAAKELRGLAEPLDAASGKLRDASIAWREVIGSRAEREAKPDDGRGFDVNDYGRAADSIGAAALQLRGLATDVDQISAPPALSAAIDHAFWRAAALALLVFALAVAYRAISSRLLRRAKVS